MISYLLCISMGLTGCGGATEQDSAEVKVEQDNYTYTVSVQTQESQTSQTQTTQDNTTDNNTNLTTSSSGSITTSSNDSVTQNLNQTDSTTNTQQSTDNGGNTSSSDPTSVTAQISWVAPETRENGDRLDVYEIAGYEVQYRTLGASSFNVVRIPEDGTGQHNFTLSVDTGTDYELLIASYDLDGLFSKYIRKVVSVDS